MTTATRVRVLRSINYLCMVGVVFVSGALLIFESLHRLDVLQRSIGIGILLILILIWCLVQRRLDLWLLTALDRTEISNDATFDVLYDNSPVAHLTLDEAGAIIDYNPKAVHLLQTDIDALRGQLFFSLCSPDFDASILQQKLRVSLTMNELELPLITTTGSVVWVLMSTYSLRRRGEILVTLVDITEQKKVDTAKSEFVALATHQLRTPITAIRFSAELLTKRLSDGATDKNVAYLDKISRNVLRMLALINDFLNVSKLEMGTFATEPTRINLSAFITDILEEFEERTTKQHITINREDSSPDFNLQTDPRLLNIILSNLLSNAIKYTPANGSVGISFVATHSTVRIEITDSGIGIPAADIPQLFSKFFRASNARALQTEGTGLGLYVVEQAVKQLRGTIEVTSGEGIGTQFTLTLPLGTGD